ncbi:MAG: DUF2934 domain-containing protein [Bacteroidota bacterium]
MIKRYKKEDWDKFLNILSQSNRFCPITLEETGEPESRVQEGLHFIGALLGEENDARHLDIYVCKPQDARVGFLITSISSPQSLTTNETSKEGIRSLTVSHGKQQKCRIRFEGQPSSEVRRESIAKVAYCLYERRGGIGGSEFQDWGDAERLFSDWERLIEQKFM